MIPQWKKDACQLCAADDEPANGMHFIEKARSTERYVVCTAPTADEQITSLTERLEKLEVDLKLKEEEALRKNNGIEAAVIGLKRIEAMAWPCGSVPARTDIEEVAVESLTAIDSAREGR